MLCVPGAVCVSSGNIMLAPAKELGAKSGAARGGCQVMGPLQGHHIGWQGEYTLVVKAVANKKVQSWNMSPSS